MALGGPPPAGARASSRTSGSPSSPECADANAALCDARARHPTPGLMTGADGTSTTSGPELVAAVSEAGGLVSGACRRNSRRRTKLRAQIPPGHPRAPHGQAVRGESAILQSFRAGRSWPSAWRSASPCSPVLLGVTQRGDSSRARALPARRCSARCRGSGRLEAQSAARAGVDVVVARGCGAGAARAGGVSTLVPGAACVVDAIAPTPVDRIGRDRRRARTRRGARARRAAGAACSAYALPHQRRVAPAPRGRLLAATEEGHRLHRALR